MAVTMVTEIHLAQRAIGCYDYDLLLRLRFGADNRDSGMRVAAFERNYVR